MNYNVDPKETALIEAEKQRERDYVGFEPFQSRAYRLEHYDDHPCAFCGQDAETREPIRVWLADTHPPEHESVHVYTCWGCIKGKSWSI